MKMIERFQMNIRIFFFAIILVCLTVSHASAGPDLSFGMGLGYFYNGLGVNLALKGPHDFKYLGTGVSTVEVTDDDTDIGFGITAGWVRTDILPNESDKHGLGIFLSVNGGEDFDTVLSLGPSYTYFFKGTSQPGFNLGLAAGPGFTEDDTYLVVMGQIGYQF
jgi:hypothetical protein